ncbi:hypothetical protein [Candidatus Protochlamydia sp. W-9]|uniref:hypothetical protein n=1 Tax=Candidatus Protochlamydia sp. W-9 TaxID=1785087 RepID=UPI00096A636F|nr:hypothetical protein [Candidatus Protochlamydia sp. W-9]
MYKNVIMSIFAILMVGVIFLAANMKDAYKVLPGPTQSEKIVSPYAEWREFTSESGDFKVLFPSMPQYAKEAVNVPNTDVKRRYAMYAAEKINGTVFMISVITYPQDFNTNNKNTIVRSVIDELIASDPANHLLEQRDAIFQEQSAIDFHLVNKEFDIEGKSFMIDKTVYVLTYVARNRDYDIADYKHFIESFRLLSKIPS